MSFSFNGISSADMGLYVEKFPPRPFPSRKAETFDIPGRSGDLIIDTNAVTNTVQEYEVFIKGGSAGFQSRAAQVAAWLLGVKGYAELIDEYDPAIYREARFIGGISFVNALNRFGRATLTFSCKPQRYPIDETMLSGVIGNTFTIPTVAGAMPGLPMITIVDFLANTSATIETDTLRIVIPGQEALKRSIYIDFETQTIVARATPLTNVSITGTWEPLGDGDTIETTLDAGSTAPTVRIQPRRWYV